MLEVTYLLSYTIRKLLESDPAVKSLTFPCLSRTTNRQYEYRPSDYFTVAGLIRSGKVDIYETETVDAGAYGNRTTGRKEDLFLFTQKVVDNVESYLSVIVHEATHMIQDYKRLKVSRMEMELDAHFAQALYKLRTPHRVDNAKSTALAHFEHPAEQYDEDRDYLRSHAFRKFRPTLEAAIRADYGHHSDLTVRKQLDGVVL